MCARSRCRSLRRRRRTCRARPTIGLRVFDEINATMAEVTGVSPTQPEVRETFDRVRQQLPTVENIEGFLAPTRWRSRSCQSSTATRS